MKLNILRADHVQTLKQEYRQFLSENFKGLELRQPLFYSWNWGLRFDLQMGEIYNWTRTIVDADGNSIREVGDKFNEEYFKEVVRRASTIFQTAFNNSGNVIFVLIEYKYKRRKIRFPNYSFRQIEGLEKSKIVYTKRKLFYETDDKFDIRNMALIKVRAEQINYTNILTAIGNTDFEPRQPRLDKYGVFTSKEIYFLNLDRKLIFHMYDDRGLDIIAADRETLRPIYKIHNDWILDYDRKQIDKQFE